MSKDRLLAFSDGVLAIIITIMVLELRPPHGAELADLRGLLPTFAGYVLSFLYVGIYWNNHHHMLALAERVNGAVLWANLHLLFWLSLLPFTTAWMAEHPDGSWPAAVYGLDLLGAGIAYWIVQLLLVRAQGEDHAMSEALGADLKGKSSPVLYIAGIAAAFYSSWAAQAFYVAVALLWLIPDPRMERVVVRRREGGAR